MKLGEDTTSSLDTEGKCSNVDVDDILSAFLPREDTSLNSSTIWDSRIGVAALGQLSATENSSLELGIRMEPLTSTT